MSLFAVALKVYLPDPWRVEDTVREAIALLQAEYVKTLDSRELLNAALEGYRSYLEEAKKSTEGLEQLPSDLSEEKLYKAFDQARELALTRVEVGRGEELEYAGLSALVAVLGDPYCSIMTPEEYRRFQEHMAGGNFGGIGVYIELDDQDRLTVLEPIEGTPAFQAGLQAGDRIVAIDGKPTAGFSLDEAAQAIRGPEGSLVRLTLEREEKEPFEVEVKRAQIHVPSVTSELLDSGLGYVKVQMFGETTGEEFDESLQELQEQQVKGLILDLRNNGGGYIRAAHDVVSRFLPRGEEVVSVVNARTGREEPSYSSGSDQLSLPTVVLLNRYSASASEITAGALKDHRRATLVGEKSFGKASVQQLHQFDDGGAMKYTVAHYLTPSGKDIHRKGIEADLQVEFDPHASEDVVLEAAEAFLKKELATR